MKKNKDKKINKNKSIFIKKRVYIVGLEAQIVGWIWRMPPWNAMFFLNQCKNFISYLFFFFLFFEIRLHEGRRRRNPLKTFCKIILQLKFVSFWIRRILKLLGPSEYCSMMLWIWKQVDRWTEKLFNLVSLNLVKVLPSSFPFFFFFLTLLIFHS